MERRPSVRDGPASRGQVMMRTTIVALTAPAARGEVPEGSSLKLHW